MTSAPTKPGGRGPRLSGEERIDLVRDRLIESRLTPNAISLTGLALCVAGAVLVYYSYWTFGALVFLAGSILDTLDGRYSRMSGKGTPFGAFLDSTLDRASEGILLTAVAVHFTRAHNELASAAVVVAVLSSVMVSYTRARAEALGVECKVGIATRAVRVAILCVGIGFARHGTMPWAIYALAVLSSITVLQRVWHVRAALT